MRYENTSATDIAEDIINSASPDFTANVEPGLPVLDVFEYSLKTRGEALKMLADRVNATVCFVDYDRVVHFWVTPQMIDLPSDITDVTTSGDQLMLDTNIGQLRTRQRGLGVRVRIPALVPAGSTAVPVDALERLPANGQLLVAGQLLIFGGTTSSQAQSGIANAPAAPSVALSSTTGGGVLGAVLYRVTGVTPNGETVLGAASASVTGAVVSPPSAPTATASSTVDAGLAPGAYKYKVTYEDSENEETTPSSDSTNTVHAVVDNNSAFFSASGTTGGALTLLTDYYYRATFYTARGETLDTATGVHHQLTGSNNAVSMTGVPTSGDGRVIGRRIYRVPASGTFAQMRLIGTIGDNTTTTFTDTMSDADAAVQPLIPSVNTTGGQITVTNIQASGDGRVRRRHLYRTVAGGSVYFHLKTLGDNTTTSFVDNTPDTSLGTEAPAANTTGHTINVTNIPTVATATARNIYRTTGGGSVYRFCGAIPDNTTTTFSDDRTDKELGQPFKVAGYLTGISATVRNIVAGEIGRLHVVRDDAAAQAIVAAAMGRGAGIFEGPVLDDDTLDQAGLEEACDAEIATFSTSLRSVTFRSRDPKLQPGKTITFNLGGTTNIVGTFVIQRVTTTEMGVVAAGRNPLRTVTAGPVLTSYRKTTGR